MRLADRVAQCRIPLVVRSANDGSLTNLSGAATFAKEVAACPTRYLLSDELIRLCVALAYSKGARTLACSDLLHVPAQRVWLEWCEAPWLAELRGYGFESREQSALTGRRGALIHSSPTGRSGSIRAFWARGDRDTDVLASSMEAYFDFDTEEGDVPRPPDASDRPTISVFDQTVGSADLLRRCFRFRYETTWHAYYAKATLSHEQREAIARQALGTIAVQMPVILAFFLLLATRPGLPRRPVRLERLNLSRSKSGKVPLLDHMEVFAPLLPDYARSTASGSGLGRRRPRLHHVRGHLVRRGSQLFWRIPHLRGNSRAGALRTRTVTWTLDRPLRESR